jgi:hypothetical protein
LEDPAREVGPADPDPPHEEAAGPTQRVVQDQIRKDILAIHRDS